MRDRDCAKTGGIPMNLHQANELTARSLAYPERTVALLTDERPGFKRDEAIAIGRFLQEQDYWVYEITVKEFMAKNLATIGVMLVIPHAESVPAEFAQSMKHYWIQGGQIVVLGGPIFRDLVEEEDGKYVKKELPPTVLDAQHMGKTGDITIEGLIPTHKIYLKQDARKFMTEKQYITKAEIAAEDAQNVVCPSARPYGIGYGMEHPCRFIPLVQVMEEGGRGEGRRGAAAFMMLNDTRGHLRHTNGTRPGSVSCTTMGSAIANIGVRRQDLMNLKGFPELLADMVNHMFRGLYLYEAGATEFVYHPGDKCCVGAKILNTMQDFEPVKVEFALYKAEEDALCQEKTCCKPAAEAVFEQSCLALPRTYTECSLQFKLPGCGSYKLVTRLMKDGAVVDEITQELTVKTATVGKSEDFVKIQGRDFVLNGKQWNMLGMNYWPLYYPTIDREQYWMGWMDKSNYDPVEVERDLQLLEDMGVNSIYTRMDGNVFGRSIPQLKDFMVRLEKHNMKLSLSYVNATNPLHYSKEAFRKLMDEAELHGNPVLMGHDISWEIGPQYFSKSYLAKWKDKWVLWIEERYGSIENAEKDWGVPVDRDAAGTIICPPIEQLEHDGPWRVKICAFRRYMDDFLSRVWNDAVSDMRKVDPDHLIAYRMGVLPKNSGCALTSTNKHTDYSGLEGYTFEENEDGRLSSQCATKVTQLLTGGKPVVWLEYGNNLIGISGNSPWSLLKWDRENLRAPEYRYDDQIAYYKQFFKMFKACDIAGTAPWWYAGGFRRVECSDCGFVEQDGTRRPVADEFERLGREWLLPERKHREPDMVVSYDPDVHSAGWGKFYMGSGPIDRLESGFASGDGTVIGGEREYGAGVQACREAEEKGLELAITTPGFGTTSVDVPLVAVGNVPYNGSNPHKYLNAEFNSVKLYIGEDQVVSVRNGDKICVPAGAKVRLEANVGNLKESTWIAGDTEMTGAVCLAAMIQAKESASADAAASQGADVAGRSADADCAAPDAQKVLLPILKDTAYLKDAQSVCGVLLEQAENDCTVKLCMEAVNRATFGEVWSFTLSTN